jgi:type I restriction enzyme M protein
MQSTFEKIIKDGERKGYFRLHNDGTKIEYLPSGHKENLNDPEEKVRAEYYSDLIEKYGYPAASKIRNAKKTFLLAGEH